MSQATLQNAPDLRKGYPRSPNALVGDFVLLGRILDKCRAVIAGTNGEYKFACPLDMRFFDWAGIDPETFKNEVAQGKSDEEILRWVESSLVPKRSQEDILAWCYEQRWAAPDNTESRYYFEMLRREAAPNHPYVQSWFQLLDAEEGRLQKA